ncbi:P-type conjugative transfer protein TrbJ [Deltaproteobacteria bacterium OttesenSCG-928-M10]|nr:P-type conjugative transfer protein TrbJ [Deltaproteobacteria bacterium OttesenSCG-928-M10]
MKRIITTLAITLLLTVGAASSGRAATVYCANCSTNWTQAMERVTNLDQLKQLLGTYQEAIQQTQQQIALVQNNIQQYQNMLKNTLSLPANILNQVKGEFSKLAQLTNQLNTLKGDVLAMGEVFDDIYPDLELLKNIAGGKGDVSVKDIWTKWSKETDRAAQSAFQVTGTQLKDLTENSDALDAHIGNLLSTPEGQMQAIQSGNSLAALQIKELRDMRLMMATNIQAATQAMMKDEKREQLSVETREMLLDESGLASQYQGYK